MTVMTDGRISKFSVITVCRNPGSVIDDALRSVHAQSFPNVEHIIIDGASTDGTAERLRGIIRPGDLLVSEPDAGLYDAMNKGVARATGDVIALLNADDQYADVDVLSRVAKCFEESGTDAVLGDVIYVLPGSSASIRRFNTGMFTPSRIGWGWMPAHPAMMLKRTAYRRVGAYRTDFGIAGDFEFVARAFGRHRLTYAYLRDVFVRMRCGGASALGRPSRRGVNRNMLRACRDNEVPSNPFMICSRYFGKALEMVRR